MDGGERRQDEHVGVPEHVTAIGGARESPRPNRGLALIGICGFVVGLVDNVLRPLLLSGRTSVNGLIVFLGLLGGVGLFGFVGLVIGPIVLVIASTLLEALTRRPQDHRQQSLME